MSDRKTDTASLEKLRRDTAKIVNARIKRRYRAERRFRLYGLTAIVLSVGFVAFLFISIIGTGYTAFWQTYIKLEITFDEQVIDPQGTRDPQTLRYADYGRLVREALQDYFPEVSERREMRRLFDMISSGARFELRNSVLNDPSLIGTTQSVWVAADDDVDMLMKGNTQRDWSPEARRLTDQQVAWIDRLMEMDAIEKRFNAIFFTSGDSREPEQAGIAGAVMGSALMLIVTLLLSFPLGVATAVYLEEFAPKNRWTDLIEVNINNLAAVPSIIFGLLGLAVFLNFFGFPRSTPLVGGLVLTLMTLPTIIIASRSALKSVSPSIRDAALGVGASNMQAMTHHILPLALPGMLTGTIIGMAQALGETAPLLMIGMVAFIVDIPDGFTDAATALPVQVYLWSTSPERAFIERTSAAIMVLLAFLLIMNATAILLRRRLERRW